MSPLGQHAGHDVHARAGKGLRVGKRGDDAGRELVLAAGQRGEATFPRGEVARRRVDQHLLETVRAQARGEILRGEVVAEPELDGAEAVLRGGSEAVEEGHLGVQERQVGGEAGHAAKVCGLWAPMLPRASVLRNAAESVALGRQRGERFARHPRQGLRGGC